MSKKVIALSFGVTENRSDCDLEAMARLRKLMKPGGVKESENRWTLCDREHALNFKAAMGSWDLLKNVCALGCFVLRPKGEVNESGAKWFENVPVEKVKTYWDSRPCNIRHSFSKVGTRQYFDEVETRKYFVEPHIPRFAEFEKWKGKRVLEIGCGIGTDTMNFARAGAQVTAVDLSDKSLELAKQRAEIYGLTANIEFYQANAEELASVVPVVPYDLVYSFGVIHHTPHPERVIEQIRYFVKPGTTLKLMVYHRYSLKVLWILLTYGRGAFWQLDELVARHSEAQTGCPITYTYSKQAIRELLTLNGFKITDIWVDHIFPYKIEDYVHYHYNKVWYFRGMPQPLFRWLERHFGWHLCVTVEARGAQNGR